MCVHWGELHDWFAFCCRRKSAWGTIGGVLWHGGPKYFCILLFDILYASTILEIAYHRTKGNTFTLFV
jgi:hypothetical protein